MIIALYFNKLVCLKLDNVAINDGHCALLYAFYKMFNGKNEIILKQEKLLKIFGNIKYNKKNIVLMILD